MPKPIPQRSEVLVGGVLAKFQMVLSHIFIDIVAPNVEQRTHQGLQVIARANGVGEQVDDVAQGIADWGTVHACSIVAPV